MSNYIESLNWRYATKKFDSSKKISPEQLEIILEAIKLSPSSYGLQPYHVLVISNNEIREKLKEVSWGQSQITDASHLIVLASKTTFNNELIDEYISSTATIRELSEETLKDFGDFMKSKLIPLSDATKENWAAKQTYIALGNLLSAAATIKVDTCPMEGFDAAAYNKILGLSEKNLNAAVVAAIGFRSNEDDTQHYKKVRQSNEKLFTQL